MWIFLFTYVCIFNKLFLYFPLANTILEYLILFFYTIQEMHRVERWNGESIYSIIPSCFIIHISLKLSQSHPSMIIIDYPFALLFLKKKTSSILIFLHSLNLMVCCLIYEFGEESYNVHRVELFITFWSEFTPEKFTQSKPSPDKTIIRPNWSFK
jgi:hypothetical protein